EHAALRSALGPVPPTPISVAAEAPLDADSLVAAWRRAAETLDVPTRPGVDGDLASVAALWATPTAPRALVHSDACPDNCVAAPLDEDVEWGRAGGRRRLLQRLGLFAGLAERRGHVVALGAWASAAQARLAARWPADTDPPALFPAFR